MGKEIITRYLQKQFADISQYGARKFKPYNGVATKMAETITPFKRLSKKPCTLSDPDFFIKEFEQKQGAKFLPKNWHKMSKKKKVDYIVHERYNQLVANKCMNRIKDENIEHGFSIRQDGELCFYGTGTNRKCSILTEPNIITVHNHPMDKNNIEFIEDCAVDIPTDVFRKNTPFSLDPHSDIDICTVFGKGGKHYVVDSNGNKFKLEISKMPTKEEIIEIFKGMFTQAYKDMNLINSDNILSQKLQALNEYLKTIDKNTEEYKTLADMFKQLVYEDHNAYFDKKHFQLLASLIKDFGSVFSLDGKGGMRLVQIC